MQSKKQARYQKEETNRKKRKEKRKETEKSDNSEIDQLGDHCNRSEFMK
jgi:hypothetical protein